MAEKKKIEVDEDLLKTNLGTMHTVFVQAMTELHQQLTVDATKMAMAGEVFDVSSVVVAVNRKGCPEESKDQKNSPEILTALLAIIQDTTKNKEPNSENLDELIDNLAELFKKTK